MSSGGSGSDRYGRSPGHENAAEKALRKLQELEAARVRQYENLSNWVREKNAAMAREKPAHDKAKKAHEAFLSISEKLHYTRGLLQSMADSTTEAKHRRNKNRAAVDEYGNMSAEDTYRYEHDRDKRRYELQRQVDHFEEMYYSYKSVDQEAQERFKALSDEVKYNQGHINKVQEHIQELNEKIERWKIFVEDQERRRRQQDLHPRWPPGDGPGGPSGGSSGGRQGHGAPFGYGGGRYAADYEARSRGGASHGSQTYGGSGGYRRAAGQTYATPDDRNKQDVADRLATLAIDGEQQRRESKPAASKTATSKTKPAATTTAPSTRVRANPPGQAVGGSRPSRR